MLKSLIKKHWALSIKEFLTFQMKLENWQKEFIKEPKKLMRSKRDSFKRAKHHMNEIRNKWRNLKNLRFFLEWNKNTLKLLNFIHKLKINNKLTWPKRNFKNFLEFLLKWTWSLILNWKKKRMSLAVYKAKKFNDEFKPSRKSNFLFYLKLLRRYLQCRQI